MALGLHAHVKAQFLTGVRHHEADRFKSHVWGIFLLLPCSMLIDMSFLPSFCFPFVLDVPIQYTLDVSQIHLGDGLSSKEPALSS